MLLEEFNASTRDAALDVVKPALDVPRWYDAIVDGRPYASIEALTDAAMTVAAPLAEAELDAALAHHPRIGERADGNSREAGMSRSEQAGVDPADSAVQEALRRGNLAYEERFGRVFLIRAAGRTAPEVLAELRRRLDNDEATERAETVAQLREIALLRLPEVVGA